LDERRLEEAKAALATQPDPPEVQAKVDAALNWLRRQQDLQGKPRISAAEGLALLAWSKLAESPRKSSMRNMQYLLLLLQDFEETHQRWPKSLAELKADYTEYEKLLDNPRTGDNPGFYYEPPREATSPILWELKDGQVDRAGIVGYADGRLMGTPPWA